MITLKKQHRVNRASNWETRKLKYLASDVHDLADSTKDQKHLALENIESWTGKLLNIDDEMTLDSAKEFHKDDVLFGKLRPYLAKVHHAQFDGACVGELLVLRPKVEIAPQYLFYRLLSHDFISVVDNSTTGAKMPRAEWGFMSNLHLEYPIKKEQQSIATYLDEKCALIDHVIAGKKKQIEILEEQRAAIINRAVTKGLDENIGMKESGVEWIGEIPKSWDLVPLKWFLRIKSGDFLEDKNFSEDGNIAVFGGNGEMGRTSLINASEETIVIGRVGANCGNVYYYSGDLWVTDNALVLFCIRGFNLEYLAQVLRLRNLNDLANKSAQPLITGTMVKNVSVPMPPLEKQGNIVRFIHENTRSIDSLFLAIQNSISLLNEYKTSLISHVVTGKVKVS